jgi:hypothetical protein
MDVYMDEIKTRENDVTSNFTGRFLIPKHRKTGAGKHLDFYNKCS